MYILLWGDKMLNENQLSRYSKQIILSDISLEGQEKLLDSKVLVECAGVGFMGTLMAIIPDVSPCYRCLNPIPPQDGTVPSCVDEGILGLSMKIDEITLNRSESCELCGTNPIIKDLVSYEKDVVVYTSEEKYTEINGVKLYTISYKQVQGLWIYKEKLLKKDKAYGSEKQ